MKLLSKLHSALAAVCLMAICSATIISCSDKDDEPESNPVNNTSTGVSGQSWTGTAQASTNGETLTFTFKASRAWTATSNQSWATVTPAQGNAGQCSINVTVEPNTAETARQAEITIAVEGFSVKALITINQAGTIPVGAIDESTVQGWMKSYMAQKYLWNEPIMGLNPSTSLSASTYLTKLLDGVDALDHMNRDDGHWKDGQRQYYYSHIDSESRSRAGQETGSGVMYMSYCWMDNNKTKVGLLPLMVSPGSPAATADIRRGDIIDQIDGTAITATNYSTMANKLYNGGCKVRHLRVVDNSLTTVNASLTLGSSTFTEPAIYKSAVYTTQGGNKVAYLLYMGFEYTFDQSLIDVFNQFKQQGVTDLVLDLRYNGGGHVRSSLLLGTLIAGDAKKDQIYSHTTYNAARTAKGEEGFYRIGDPSIPEGSNGSYVTYSRITNGLNASLGLNRIYVICSENTASASELVINGLKGLDIDVRLIGTTTNGKNVGMEPTSKTFGSMTYNFVPITFYSCNAKGFKDYADGFVPDFEFDENEYWPVDFGTSEPCLLIALNWIDTGVKPSLSSVSRAGSIKTKKSTPIINHNSNRLSGSIKLTEEF